MAPGTRTLSFAFAAVAAGAAGCATCPQKIQRALEQAQARPASELIASYTLACPDVLLVHVDGRPLLDGSFPVQPDGCISLGELGRVRVDGATPRDVADLIARSLRLSASNVRVEVGEYGSRYVLLIGPADGVQRVVPYQGPERVTDCLRRCGGLQPGAAFNAIHVVRPHVAVGRRPEVFPVDLEAIVMKNDSRTDLPLEPYDQVYLGETRGSSVVRSLPPWLRHFCPGLREMDAPAPAGKD